MVLLIVLEVFVKQFPKGGVVLGELYVFLNLSFRKLADILLAGLAYINAPFLLLYVLPKFILRSC